MQQGITFETGGGEGPIHDRPFPWISFRGFSTGRNGRASSAAWPSGSGRSTTSSTTSTTRARSSTRGSCPWRLVASCSHFARAVHGIRPPGGVYTHVAGCDLVRHSDGSWRVIEDNVRIPSGISYVLENRAAMARLVPELFASYRVRPIEHYPQLLLGALRAVAPSAESEATVVVWTPGPANPAYFEHAFLARQMGVELVEASDLVVRDDVLYMRTIKGLERAHAVYRRIDDDFVDPLEFRGDSLLGVPGLVRAYRAGNVAIANALGTGVADDKAIYRFVPEMIRFYLGEEPILENVRTYLPSDPEVLEHVLGRLDELVVKPTGESGGRGVMIGPHADEREIARMRLLLAARPGPLDRPGRGAAVDRPGRGRQRRAGPPPRRPAPVRGVRRAHRHRPRRPHAGGARGGVADRQLIPRRRLEGHVGARGRRRRRPRRAADRRHPAAGAAGPPLRHVGRASSSNSSNSNRTGRPPDPRSGTLMLARIAHELYWLGRNLARAEFTARAVEAVLQAELQGASDTAPGVSFGSGGLLAMLGDERRLPRPRPDARSADPRSRAPGIDAGEHRTVARGGAHGARRDQRGDVAGDQHHRPRAARAPGSPAGERPPGRSSPRSTSRSARR